MKIYRSAVISICFSALSIAQTYRLSLSFDDGGRGYGWFTFSPPKAWITTTHGSTLSGQSYTQLCGVDQPANCGGYGLQDSPFVAVPRSSPGAILFSFGAQTSASGKRTVTAGEISDFFFTSTRQTVSGDAIPFQPDSYSVHHFTLDSGDGVINITNAGTLDGTDKTGSICANVYAFAPTEEIVSCCACKVTPNGLVSLSLKNDIMNNTLYAGFVQNSVIVAIVATAAASGPCNAATQPTTANLARGMKAWGTTLHVLSRPGSPTLTGLSETPFAVAELSAAEFQKLTSYCNFIQLIYSGRGQCKACSTIIGAQGAEAH